MGLYNDRFLPRFVDLALGKALEGTRRRVASGLSGEVLEIGFGSGRNVPHYPAAVSRVHAVEPALHGREIAAKRVAASPIPIAYVGLDGQALPLGDETIDHVIVTWTLCTIPDADRALEEVHRVLRPGGGLHFVEHGRSPRANVAKWQDRITPMWSKVFGGCHLNRSIPDMIDSAGLTVTALNTYQAQGPELVGLFFEGTAVKNQP